MLTTLMTSVANCIGTADLASTPHVAVAGLWTAVVYFGQRSEPRNAFEEVARKAGYAGGSVGNQSALGRHGAAEVAHMAGYA